jgi:cytochrome c-type biogenesis protein CcmH/NrfG
MAIGWLSVLKLVPWGDVISNAPRIADEAKKLWNGVAKKPIPPQHPNSKAQAVLSPVAQSIVELEAQLGEAVAEISQLHHQMLESSELIKALADQNTQLIKRVEETRIRVLWLAGLVAVMGVAVTINLIMTLAG